MMFDRPDPFGLKREQKILASGIRDIFTHTHPVKTIELLFGRTDEIRQIIESLNQPGQSILLFGDRGVGKTSLASISPFIAKSVSPIDHIIIKSCTSEDNFNSIFSHFLSALKIDTPKKIKKTRSSALNAEANAGFAKGGGESSRSEEREYEYGNLTVSDVATKVKDFNAVFVIDEADAINNISDKHKIGELIKHISDIRINVRILLSGISEVGSDIIDGHISAQRCTRTIRVNRMTKAELSQIIHGGSKKAGLVFQEKIIKAIVDTSDGFPHYTHLLALKCAEEAIATNVKNIDSTIYNKAQHLAANESEAALIRDFNDAIRGQSHNTLRHILLAAACTSKEHSEFQSDELRLEYKRISGNDISQGELNNFLPRIISSGRHTILRRIAKGVYCFNDPRMPCFIRISCTDIPF